MINDSSVGEMSYALGERRSVVGCLMRARVTPEPLGPLLQAGRPGAGPRLLSGRILPMVPNDAVTPALPVALDGLELADLPSLVAARVDIEERPAYARPLYSRFELGRDFYFSDGSGVALVRLAEEGYVHPDAELHLDAPFVTRVLPPDEDADHERIAYVRVVRTGDPVYVVGRLTLAHDAIASPHREALIGVLSPTAGPLALYDEPAFRQLAAWRALPWYRKLSVLVRNR